MLVASHLLGLESFCAVLQPGCQPEKSGSKLWAVVNNAGILQCAESEWMDIDDLKQILDVNTLGPIRVTKAFLPLLRQSKGRIVNLISLADEVVLSCLTPYTISKFATFAFSKSLTSELSKFSISVHNIEPWIYRTNLTECASSILEKKMEKIPEDIKNVYSDEYKEKMKQLLYYTINLTSADQSKIYQVVESIEDACFSEDPLLRYTPGAHSKLAKHCTALIDFFQPIVLKFILRSK
ncbi:Dehydrogenase/reductase SDR family protein 7-like [Gryllus bimaculatus]|nr:Dehydrogenase/reductase SDR family protein 7-like [Gryllus bimaculatus]